MPPEHDETRARQIEALQRYVAELGVQKERRSLELAKPRPAPERQRRRSLPWLLTGLLVIVALVGGGFVGALAWSGDRKAGAEAGPGATQSPVTPAATQSPSTSTPAPVASPGCKTAVDRANTMLAIAVSLQEALAEHSRILNNPSNRKLSGRELLDRSASSLKAGTSESARFSQALTAYRQVVDQCKLQAP